MKRFTFLFLTSYLEGECMAFSQDGQRPVTNSPNHGHQPQSEVQPNVPFNRTKALLTHAGVLSNDGLPLP
jgi:hypothetical protein